MGTTSTTSVDPVPAIADIAERYGMWLHVDSAYAGSAMICPGVPLGVCRVRARRFAGGESAQVAVHADGSERVLHAPAGGAAARVLAGAASICRPATAAAR